MPMLVNVVRVELAGSVIESIRVRAAGGSLGQVVGDVLRDALPELTKRTIAPIVRGSRPQITVQPGLQIGLAALSRIAEHTPPPARFTETVQLAIPIEVWRDVERERVRLGMSVDDLIAWAWRRTAPP